MENEEEEKYCSNCKRSVAAANFAIHSAFCERNIFVCKICEEPVAISGKDEHFDSYHVISPCNLCEASIEKWMLPDHMKICPKRLIVCEYCEAEFPLNDHAEHVEFCGSRTEKCLLCQKYIMMKNKDKHSELHRYEEKYNRKKIEEEIKQNKVNEEISSLESSMVQMKNSKDFVKRKGTEKGDTKPRIGANFEGMKESASNRSSCDSKQVEQGFGMHSLQGATALPDRAKEKSSRYGECHICKQSIPWIDMNIHVPSCASLAGKCSLCGEDVPNHAMKDHMKEHLTGNFQKQTVRESPDSYTNRNSSDHQQNNTTKTMSHFNDKHTDGIKSPSINEYQCPLCLEMVRRKDRHRHETSECRMLQDNESDSTHFSRSLSQNFIECSMCFVKVPEEKWQEHLSFGCNKLLEDNRSFAASCISDSSNLLECPLCLAWMPEKDRKKHELFECKVLIESVGVDIPEPEPDADSTKKNCQCPCRKRNNCGKCKSNSQHKMPHNPKYYQQRKVPCDHCKDMIDSSNRDVHDKYCPASKYNKYSSKLDKQVSSHNHKGAIPKNTNIREMMKPTVGKCKYCHTTLNMDIVKYHEDECIHRPIDCPECNRNIPMKDFENHECRKVKNKDMSHKGGRPIPEGKNESSMVKSVWNFFKPSSFREKDEKENTNRQDPYSYSPYSSSSYQPITRENYQSLYFNEADFMVPCEFCNVKVLASELVLHETGCKPDLVSYAKQEPSESPNLNKTSAKHDSVPTNTKFNQNKMESTKQPFFPGNSLSSSERIKHERKPDTKPGEFLQLKYEKSSSRNHERTGNELKGKKKENSYFQSVWNSESYTDNGNEDNSDQSTKSLEDPMDVDEYDKTKTESTRNVEHGIKFRRQTSEESDLNAFLHFVNDDKNEKIIDKENEIDSKDDEKNAELLSGKFSRNSAFDSNLLKDHLLQKNLKDHSEERNINDEGEFSRLFKENMRSDAQSHKRRVEFTAAIQQLKDSHSNSSAGRASKQIPTETSTPEKKDEVPELSVKQKILLDASTKSNKETNEDFKKYLPDLKFASPKEKFSRTDGEKNEFCAINDERCEKLFEKQITKTHVCDKLLSKEEYADSLENQTSSKFGRYQSLASCNEKNECKTKEDEKLKKQSYKNISAQVQYSENSRNYDNNFENCLPDLKFAAHEKSDILQKFDRFQLERNEEKHEAKENYSDISKHITTAKENRKLRSNSYDLTESEIAYLKLKRSSLKDTEHGALLQKNIMDQPAMPSVEKTARNTSSENECISNYKKYFPDFKFATSEKSTVLKEDNIHHTVPSEKNISKKLYEQQLGKTSKHSDFSASERESTDSFSPNANSKYVTSKSIACNDDTYQRELYKKKEDVPSKLHADKTSVYIDKMSKNEIKYSNDFKKYLPDFKFGSQIRRSSEEKISIETESKAKWNQWRETPNCDSSDSE